MSRAVLGLAIGHDASAALCVDGALVYAEEEERHVGRKPFFGFPRRSLEAALAWAGLGRGEISSVGVAWDLGRLRSAREESARRALACGNVGWAQKKRERLRIIQRSITALGDMLPRAEVVVVPHHEAHLLSCIPFARGPVGPCAGMVADAVGEHSSLSLFLRHERGIEQLLAWPLAASLGYFFRRWAEVLGFHGDTGCGYLMSLAAFGDAESSDARRIRRACVGRSAEGLPWVRPDRFSPWSGEAASAWKCFPETLLDPLRLRTPPGDPRERADVAAGVQAIITDILCAVAEHARRVTRMSDLLLSGGVAMNCVALGRLRARGVFGAVHTGASSRDSGTSVGAAVAATRGRAAIRASAAAHLGTRISGAEAAWATVVDAGLGQPVDHVAGAIVDDLERGRTVALAQGRLEFGPRALGSRSILALPDRVDNARLLNRLKRRFGFQPVAASMDVIAAERLFGLTQPEPFMNVCHMGLAEAKTEIPAALHVDGSCRLHVCDTSSMLQSVTEELRRRGRPGVVLNTSFNDRGRPLPRTAEDAIAEYVRLDVDVLYGPSTRIHLDRDARLRLRLDSCPPPMAATRRQR